MNTYVELENKTQHELYIIANNVDIKVVQLNSGVSLCYTNILDLLQIRQSYRGVNIFFTKLSFVYDPIDSTRTVVGFITNIGVLS